MKIRLDENRYLRFIPEGDETISLASENDSLDNAVSLDLTDVIGIEGAAGAQGVAGERGQSAKDILIQENVLSPTATDAEFVEAIKGADGQDGADGADGDAVNITNIEVVSTQNVTMTRHDCDAITGICQISTDSEGTETGTKTTLMFTLSNGSQKTIELLAENGNDGNDGNDGGNYVAMNATDYGNYFQGVIVDSSQVQQYVHNGVTMYVVPVSLLNIE